MTKLTVSAELNEPQLKAVRALEGPVLIIAGAGSGKTRVITCRIAAMLERGIPQSAILALTFTNKAAREMEARVKELTGKKLQSLTVCTFHAFGLKILREDIETLEAEAGDGEGRRRKNFSVYDETDKTALIKESLRECRLYSDKINLYDMEKFFSHIKTGRRRFTGETMAWEPVYREYQHGLKVYNAVDFDDLLILPLELFDKHPETLEKYRRRFRYIMVDEFQDTSVTQYELMRLLARNPDPAKRNVCVVGDDDQSIYSWRGANYENLLRFEEDFPGTVEIKLEQNYRSTGTILEAANGVISNNTNRKEKHLWSGNGGGKPIELYYPENESGEADFIASQIRIIMMKEGLKYHDFGVLVRTNALTRGIEEAFLAENIPYRVSGGTSFFQQKEIKDILSYLRVIANPGDDINLMRIINTPRRGIGKATVLALSTLARKNHSSLWDALERLRHSRSMGQQGLFQDRGTENELDDFVNLIETFREEILGRQAGGPDGSGGAFEKWRLSKKVRALADRVDYWSYLVSEYSKSEKLARWKFSNIEYLIKTIEYWEDNPDNLDPGLYPYLNRVSLITRDDGEDDGAGKVNLMTIHASKGLEFPVVFIAGAEAGIIPHEKSLEEEAGNIEEERRLFYVAITRARDKLFITSCKKRRHLQNTVDCLPSPFLTEIPPGLIEYHQEDKVLEYAEAADLFAKMRERFKGD